MLSICQIVQILSGIMVILLVLLHSPKGEGLASIGGASQLFSSQKGVEAGLNKITGIIAAVFILTSLILGLGIVR